MAALTASSNPPAPGRGRVSASLNGRYHKYALIGFTVFVLAHWVEHITQAVQVYVLSWPIPDAKGALGLAFPWLITSEWLHYGYAIGMLLCFFALRHGFHGRSRTWWQVALWIQFWHHIEHLLLLLQASTGNNLLGMAKPTSIVQLVIPRVELHLFYNTVVFIPMVLAMIFHLGPAAQERAAMACTCAVHQPATA